MILNIMCSYLIIPIPIVGGATGAPELFLIPIGLAFLLVRFRYALYLSIIAPFLNYIITPWQGAVNVFSFIFDYSLPYLSMMFYVLYVKINPYEKKYRIFYIFLINLWVYFLVFVWHTISGGLFFQFQMDGTIFTKNSIWSIIAFTSIYNFFYCLIEWAFATFFLIYFVNVHKTRIDLLQNVTMNLSYAKNKKI